MYIIDFKLLKMDEFSLNCDSEEVYLYNPSVFIWSLLNS
jgi:hypothetical protein